jgi:hypothetical protein
MDKEFLKDVLNYLLTFVGPLVFILLAKTCMQTLSSIHWKFRKLSKIQLVEVFQKMKTPLYGVVIILCAFALTNTLLGGTSTLESEELTQEALQNPNTIWEGLWAISSTGLVGTSLFIFAGLCYILSGFGAWIKWVARALMLLAPTYIFLQIFHYAVLAA